MVTRKSNQPAGAQPRPGETGAKQAPGDTPDKSSEASAERGSGRPSVASQGAQAASPAPDDKSSPASSDESLFSVLPGMAMNLARESVQLYGEWARTVLGMSDWELPAKDARFSDPVWRQHPFYQRLGQSYLAFCAAIDRVAESVPDWRQRERAKFLGGVLTSSLAPTNTLLGNPAALKQAFETGGMSLLSGTKNLVDDLLNNQGMPRQVKESAFKVGENIALTPGAVVFRNEMVELIQYRPKTQEVAALPTLLITPTIGKYYFMDLAPGRSFVEYALSRGIPIFITSWRNPGPEQGHWGIDDYVSTLLELVSTVCEISGSDKLNTLALCGGGILSTLMLAVMAERGDARVNAAAFGVMLLDFGVEAPVGALQSAPLLKMGRWKSQSKGILPASSLASVFAWMRPNDLVWNYWANNYLMGKDPPAFDILAWSVDGTNLPARLHGQFLDIFEHNLLPQKGALKVLDVPVDLKRITIDVFATGAVTDHLTPWKGCFRSLQLLGGAKTFVLSNAGHIASMVNPPGNPKATYYVGAELGDEDPEQWREHAIPKTGTWWEAWADWVLARSGDMRPAPSQLGSDRYPELGAAPGTYVLQKS